MHVAFSPEKSIATDALVSTAVLPALRDVYDFAHDMTIFIGRPPASLSDAGVYTRLLRLVTDLERLPASRGADFTLLWLRDYVAYVRERHRVSEEGVLASILAGIDGPSVTPANDTMQWRPDLTYAFLPDFCRDARYKLWCDRVAFKYRTGDNGTIELTSMVFSVIFTGTKTWASRAYVLDDIRRTLRLYPEFNATVWDYDGPVLDLILSVTSITALAGLVTMGSMLIISFIFVPSVTNVICATLTIGSMCFGLLGTLSLWNCDLDPITMINMLMAVGFCVDYTAHVTYHYYHQSHTVTSPAQRLRMTFQAVAWPMVQAGISSVLCIAPLLFNTIYSFNVFGKTVIILTIYGALHGLFVLPVALASLPQSWLSAKGADDALDVDGVPAVAKDPGAGGPRWRDRPLETAPSANLLPAVND